MNRFRQGKMTTTYQYLMNVKNDFCRDRVYVCVDVFLFFFLILKTVRYDGFVEWIFFFVFFVRRLFAIYFVGLYRNFAQIVSKLPPRKTLTRAAFHINN